MRGRLSSSTNWNTLAVCLMGGKVTDSFRLSWLLSGAIAGVVAGWFTVSSRQRCGGEGSLLYGPATYYLGILTYWFSFVVMERAWMCWQEGAWSDFNLHDHFGMLWIFLIYGTSTYGILLLASTFFTCCVVWKVYQRFAA